MGKTARNTQSTAPEQSGQGADQAAPQAGLLFIYHGTVPLCVPIPLLAGKIELGRGRGALTDYIDARMSRRHARVQFDGNFFTVEDLGSHNGTFVDGNRVDAPRTYPVARILRTGDSVFLLSPDLRPFQAGGVQLDDGLVKGPMLQAAYEQARNAARLGKMLHITGESGAGKEGVARVAHEAGSHRAGPYITVNCATIAEGVAERLLFGARRGAYSGAVADTDGLVQAANGGTLFLDEIAELPLPVQAKLLRVVETQEVVPLGANKPVPVQVHLYSATHKNLRTEVASGRFREDLYFRISRPKIGLPPLRQRLEEIPWLVDRALKQFAPQLTAKATLIERCLLRHWPGNVREILAEIHTAGLAAVAAHRTVVESADLCEDAGRRFGSTPPTPNSAAGTAHTDANSSARPPIPAPAMTPMAAPSAATVMPTTPAPPPSREVIEAALRKEKGNISRTARALGLHRTQLKRFMLRFGLAASVDEVDTED